MSSMYAGVEFVSTLLSFSLPPLPPSLPPSLPSRCRLLSYKPSGCKVGVELMTMDVETLNPGQYLNDKIMDFYFK